MQIKREVAFGIAGIVAIITLLIYYALSYSNLQNQPLTRPVVNNIQISTTPGIIVTQPAQTTNLTAGEVAKHNSASDCWIIVNNGVYQVSEYLSLHPGGAGRITPYCGSDATQAFETQGGRGSHSSRADTDLSQLKIGDLNQAVNIQTRTESVINRLNQGAIQKNSEREDEREEEEDE